MIRACGRKVYLRKGAGKRPKSQTVSICSEEDEWGVYDYRIRIHGATNFIDEGALKSKQFRSVESLVDYLIDECGGVLEQSPRVSGEGRIPEALGFGQDKWVRGAVARVDRILNAFVSAFVDRPYLHRVEHSLHCELYQMLCRDDVIGREVRMGDFATRLVHKEWPEFRPREGKGRRGNSDLVVLSPNSLAACPMRDFLDGRIEAPFVIEMGLNCDHKHLRDDLGKLLASEVSRGYLIHLVHNQKRDNYDGIEKSLIDIEIKFPNIGTAYARIEEHDRYYKLIGGRVIQARTAGNVRE